MKQTLVQSVCILLVGAGCASSDWQATDVLSSSEGQFGAARAEGESAMVAQGRRPPMSSDLPRGGRRRAQTADASSAVPSPPQARDEFTATAKILVRSAQVTVRSTVPAAESGKQIEGREDLFPARVVKAEDGVVTLTLTATPVLIEDGEPAEPTIPASFFDGPFGIEAKVARLEGMPALDTANMAREAGMSWIRYCQPNGLLWGMIERAQGQYDWASLDFQAQQAQASKLHMQVVIYPYARWDNPEAQATGHGIPAKYPNHMDAYLAFIHAAVERYDGDGAQDAPGSPEIKCWEVGSEIDTRVKWSDTPEHYALLLKQTYEAIKAEDPSATVLMSGWMMQLSKRLSPDYWDRVLKELARLSGKERKPCYDVGSVHWFLPEPADLSRYLQDMRDTFTRNGFPVPRLWITSLATFTGGPQRGPEGFRGITRAEAFQAEDIVKLNIAALAEGVEKTFWGVLCDLEENLWWNRCGIVAHEGGGAGPRKLGFHTYRFLNEELAQFVPGTIERVEGQAKGVCLYRYTPSGKGSILYFGWASSRAAR